MSEKDLYFPLRNRAPETPLRNRNSRVRQRRNHGPRAKADYRELPPITARGVVNDFAIEHRKKAGKRRFNAAFSLPRPHNPRLPLPSARIQVGWRLLSFMMVLLFGTGLYLFWTLPEFRVHTARITGNQRIPADEINTALELDGKPVFLQTPARIRERALQAYPELASVEVSIDLPNLVTVNVTEREPVILWQQDGSYTWVDETGTAFRPRGEAPGSDRRPGTGRAARDYQSGRKSIGPGAVHFR